MNKFESVPYPNTPALHSPTLSYNLCIIMQLSSALNRCFQLVYQKIEQVICGKQTGKSLGPHNEECLEEYYKR